MNWLISILLADDHALVRETVADRLRSEKDFEVVATVSNAGEAVVQVELLKPDIVLMDIDMPGKVCFDAAREIKAFSPLTRIIYLSAFFHDRYIQDALAAGAAGYVTKDEPADVLVKAIRMATSGIAYFSPTVQARILVTDAGVTLLEQPAMLISQLTRREIEVLRYISRGLSRKEITALIHVSIKTLDNHISRIKKKLQIQDRVELARFAIREGLADA